jgi:hypothetical protein
MFEEMDRSHFALTSMFIARIERQKASGNVLQETIIAIMVAVYLLIIVWSCQQDLTHGLTLIGGWLRPFVIAVTAIIWL